MKIKIKYLLSRFLTVFLLITIFSVSIPTHKAQAGFFSSLFGGGGINQATESTQQLNNIELAHSTIQNTITAGAVTSLASKETLDGIAWQIAKQMVSNMTKSLVSWINSGFQGSPAFVTDINAMLLDALDTTAGEYIKSLGKEGEFICSPFKLDVQAALTLNYNYARSGMPSGPTAPACKLSDIENNIQNFFSGISDGGYSDWFEISSSPQNTPYGAYLEAESKLNVRLVNEAGQELKQADWGQGFLSKKICESIEGSTTGKNCTITTPGQVISQAINFQLSSGPRSLIEADEINEIIGALINQLTLQAMQGVNGLLGLGGNSSYTAYSADGNSYLDDAVKDQTYINTDGLKLQIDQSLTTENTFLNLIDKTLIDASSTLKTLREASSTLDFIATSTDIINKITAEASSARPQVIINIAKLNQLIFNYNNASSTASSTNQAAGLIRQNVILDYLKLVDTAVLTSPSTVTNKRTAWDITS